MVISFDSHSVTLFALFSILWSQGSGFPAEGSNPGSRIKRQSDEFFLQEYTKMLAQLSARKYLKSLIGYAPSKKRHTDGLFTSEDNKTLGKLAVEEFLNSLLGSLNKDEESDSANLSDTEPPGDD